MTVVSLIIGITLILYGIAKIFIGTTSLMVDSVNKRKLEDFIPPLKWVYVDDETLAGSIIEVVFISFGVYSLLHGLSYIHVLDDGQFTENNQISLITYTVFGLILTILYSIIVYTNVRISKDITQYQRYKLIGIFGGLTFLIMIPLTLIYPKLVNFQITDIGMYLWSLLTVIILCLMYKILKDTSVLRKEDTLSKDIITLVMIPLNLF